MLYVIGWVPKGPLKVGRSISPDRLLSELQASSPYPLKVVATGTATRAGIMDTGIEAKALELVKAKLQPVNLGRKWFDTTLPEVVSAGGRRVTWLIRDSEFLVQPDQ